MKKIISYTLFVSLSLLSSFCSASGQENDATISNVVVPYVPSKLNFAGEEAPISRFDVKERLEEDLSVTCYMHSRTLRTLRSSARYFPIIEPILKENGVPSDFKYLAMAESSLIPTTVSPAGAAGIWQIMSGTASEYGLEVNKYVDERYDIEKATRAACRYLKKAYAKFGNWTLAAASYNAGMAGVSRRQESQNSVDSYYDILMPEETMRYIYRILSFKLVEQQPAKYGFMIAKEQYYKPYEYTTIKVSGTNISWSKIAADNGTTYYMLRLLNPWIRLYTHPNSAQKSYNVKIPLNE